MMMMIIIIIIIIIIMMMIMIIIINFRFLFEGSFSILDSECLPPLLNV